MILKDLVGEHMLSGLDEIQMPAENTYDDAYGVIRFVLDGLTYKAVENPDDGYRSYLRDIDVTDEKVHYNFPPQRVIGRMMPDGEEGYSDKNDVITFYDAETDKEVLSIGTTNYDDYYPTCVLNWYPQNLAINQIKTAPEDAALNDRSQPIKH